MSEVNLIGNPFQVNFSLEDINEVMRPEDRENLSIIANSLQDSYSIEYRCNLDLDLDANASLYAMEGIMEQAKNKAKRAGHAGLALAKKAINYIFGFILNIFKGTLNVKVSLQKIYKKAKEYDKKLQTFVNSSIPEDFELESKDYAKRSNASLIMIRGIVDMTKETLRIAEEQQDAEPIAKGIKISLTFSDLINSLTSDGAKIKPNEVIEEAKKTEDGTKVSFVKNFFSKAKENVESGWNGMVQFGVEKKENVKDKFTLAFKTDPDKIVEVMNKRAEALSKIVELYSQEPSSKTVKADQLFLYFKSQLGLFLKIVEKNSWDFTKVITQLSKVRSQTIKALDKLQAPEDADDKSKEKFSNQLNGAFKILTAMGKNMSDLTPLVKKLLDNVKSDFDNLITEISKCASKASKVS